MLMTPEPMLPLLNWGDKRRADGGKRGRVKAREYARSLEKANSKAADIAQPNRYDAMHAPVYKAPAASVPVRSGSEDFLRIASRGVRC